MDKISFDLAAVKKVKFKMILWFTSFFTLIVVLISILIIRRTNILWREKVLQLETALNNECNKNLNTLIKQVENASDYMEVLTEEINKNFHENKYSLEEKTYIQQQLSDFFSNFSAIRAYDNLSILYNDGTYVGTIHPLNNEKIDAGQLYKTLDKTLAFDNGKKNWFTGIQGNYDEIFYVERIYENAIFMCSLNSSKIEEFVINTNSIQGLKSIKTILINSQNTIIYSPEYTEMGTTVPSDAIEKMNAEQHINEGKYYTLSDCSNGWKLISSVALKELLSERRFIITYVIVLATIAISVILIFCIVFSLQLTIPIENLIMTLHNQATKDKTTRFFNESTFTSMCNSRLKQFPEKKHALFYVDIDHFNYLLEYMGRDECEKIIEEVADSLRHVFPKAAIFCRAGTDRLLVFSEIKNNEQIYADIVDYCTEIQNQLFARFQGDFDVTASTGVSIYPNHEKRYSLLLKFSEKAMNVVKKEGRNGFHIFDPENDLKTKA